MSDVALGGSAAPAGLSRVLGIAVYAAVVLVLGYAAFTLYLDGQALYGALILAVMAGFALIFGFRRFYFGRFIFPGVAAIAIFIAFPVLYTVYLGFTNYSSFNLLSFERAREVQLSQKVVDTSTERPFALVAEAGGGYRVFFPAKEGEGGFLSAPVPLDGSGSKVSAEKIATAPADLMAVRNAIKLRKEIAKIAVTLPDGTELHAAGIRDFAEVRPEYVEQADGTLKNTSDGSVLTPDQSKGFYVTADGKTVAPGWRVNVGLANFERIFTSAGIRAPMVTIFIWTVVFATLSVGLTFVLGLVLAVILQWPHLRFKGVYRVLLILPYAVPAFISILVFRGLFNQNFGEINMILSALFGVRPNWFTDGGLARSMLVIVNVWLGYPYMMLLAMGFLQSVPEDHKKAAALEGASALRVFFTITLPQIIPPFLPLLIASFAFNFNNIVLILLLTRGLPDIPGTLIPAGQTDILGSFTYRIAFMDSGQQFGLAGAISFLIFVVVGALAYANFVVMRRAANKKRYGA